MHGIENKSLWKDEMSYGCDTWYTGEIFEQLKNYACILLIFISIINQAYLLDKLIKLINYANPNQPNASVIFQLCKCTIHIHVPSTTTIALIHVCFSSCAEDSRTGKNMSSIRHSVAEIFNAEVAQNQQLSYFYCSVANMVAYCIKHEGKVQYMKI